jgi:hypothetical protein
VAEEVFAVRHFLQRLQKFNRNAKLLITVKSSTQVCKKANVRPRDVYAAVSNYDNYFDANSGDPLRCLLKNRRIL